MAEWISVEDRLPEERAKWPTVRYLVCSEKGYIDFAYYQGDNDWCTVDSAWHRTKIDVTYWMPLPESPQAKSWAACIGDARDGTTISITIDVSDSNLPLSEFEDRIYKIFERAMTGIKREWGDDG